jgi:CRP-like cAMP-binding protein
MADKQELQNVDAALAKAELMAALSDETRARLAKQGVPCTVEPGKLLFAKGDKGDALYVLLEGEVEVRISTEGGKDVRMAALKPPALIGEMAVLDGGVRSADICAIRKSRFLRIHRDQAIAALESEPKALLKLIAEMSRRLRHADAALEDAHTPMLIRAFGVTGTPNSSRTINPIASMLKVIRSLACNGGETALRSRVNLRSHHPLTAAPPRVVG